MTVPTLQRPIDLAPTGDPTPMERAVINSIAGEYGPETFLWINFRRPDGTHIRYAWTAAGRPLGDRIDALAMAAGLDAADWFHIADLHQRIHIRGQVETWAYALRPVLADVKAGVRAPEEQRENLLQALDKAVEGTEQQSRTWNVRWLGFGTVLTQRPN